MRAARTRALGVFTALALAGCAPDGPAVLVFDVASDLEIGREVNELRVRLRADGVPIAPVTYALGEGDRSAWPQVLPVVEADLHPSTLVLRVELAWRVGEDRVLMGANELQARFPQSGTQNASIYVRRACNDFDNDGFGVGYGCDEPDCDDFDPAVPLARPCEAVGARCEAEADCPSVHFACLDHQGVCVCRRPCVVPAECPDLECKDGCCQL